VECKRTGNQRLAFLGRFFAVSRVSTWKLGSIILVWVFDALSASEILSQGRIEWIERKDRTALENLEFEIFLQFFAVFLPTCTESGPALNLGWLEPGTLAQATAGCRAN
jgi:hypothetical protein